MRKNIFLLLIIFAFGFVLLSIKLVKAAVVIHEFKASGYDGYVIIQWTTGTEINNAGFFVKRSDNQFSDFVEISPYIPSTGGSGGDTYGFTDINVVNGTKYWYLLEAVDNQAKRDPYGPVSAIPGVAWTATPTTPSTAAQTGTTTGTTTVNPTTTPTPSSTATTTGTTAASTSTTTGTPAPSTPTRTSAAYPGPATATSQSLRTSTPTRITAGTPQPTTPGRLTATAPLPQSGTPQTPQVAQATTGLAPTNTLIPLPTVTFVFPDRAEQDATPKIVITRVVASSGGAGWATPQRIMVVGLLVVIWGLLGGWFYFSMHKLE